MKITTTAKTLTDALKFVAAGISKRPPVPVLAGVRLTLTGDQLTLSATDYEVTFETVITVDVLNDLFTSTPQRALLNHGELTAAVKGLPARTAVTVEIGTFAVVTAAGFTRTLSLLPLKEYPQHTAQRIGAVDAGYVFGAGELQRAVAALAPFASKTPVHLAGREAPLTGIMFDPAGGRGLVMYSSDKYRAGQWTTGVTTNLPLASYRSVPATELAAALKAFPADASSVVEFDADHAYITTFDGTHRVRVSTTNATPRDMEMPVLGRVFPDAADVPNRTTFDTAALRAALKGLSVGASKTAAVRVSADADRDASAVVLELVDGSEGSSASVTVVLTDDTTHTSALRQYNSRFLLSSLGAKSAPGATVTLHDPAAERNGKPSLVTTTDTPELRVIIMPIRIAS